MTVEEGEKEFGKRWPEWTVEEKKRFVSKLDSESGILPLCLRLVSEHTQLASGEVKAEILRILMKVHE